MSEQPDGGLTTHADGSCWLSAHLHFYGHLFDAVCDRMLVDVVAPFVRACQARNWITSYFFVRYGADGPHVRVRLGGTEASLRRDVAPALLAYVTHAQDRSIWPASAAPCLPPYSDVPVGVRWVAYEPEFTRYGGAEAVRVAEAVFASSSELAVDLVSRLSNASGSRSQRLSHGVSAITTLLRTFTRSDAELASLAARHADLYGGRLRPDRSSIGAGPKHARDDVPSPAVQAHVRAICAAVAQGGDLPSPLGRFRDAISEARNTLEEMAGHRKVVLDGTGACDWPQAVEELLPSFAHMTYNRLGITRAEEVYLSRLISAVFCT